MRNLWRAREDAVNMRLKVRQQLKAFLLRQDRRYAGKTSWTKMHQRWIAAQCFSHPAAQIALTEYQLAVQAAEERVQRLTTALQQAVQGWRFEPVVAALRALRGIDSVSAIGLVCEIGDINRFATARQLMGYLGLVPSEHSSGGSVRHWLDHQDRQCARAAPVDRGSLEIPFPSAPRQRVARPQQGAAAGHPDTCMEGPGAPVRTIRATVGPRRAGQQGLRGSGVRVGWICLGHCSADRVHPCSAIEIRRNGPQ